MNFLFLRILFSPFGIFYSVGVYLRNFMFQRHIFNSVEFEIPVISVGNLRAGGTGKTPMVEYLVRLLSGKTEICTLSRGYKRRTSGFRMATLTDTPQTIGDEPYQLYLKFRDVAHVAVGEDRMLAIPEIVGQFDNSIPTVIMDDAFQHRSVKPAFNILLTTWSKPFFRDYILPYGFLREPRKNAARADCVIITKCPDNINEKAIEGIKDSVSRYVPGKDVYFTTVEYGVPVPISGAVGEAGKKLILVTAIADPAPLLNYLGQQQYRVIHHLKYGDHHSYNIQDCTRMRDLYRSSDPSDLSILTTEKDMVKLSSPEFKGVLESLPVFYIPIGIRFVKDGRKFDQSILQIVEKYKNPG